MTNKSGRLKSTTVDRWRVLGIQIAEDIVQEVCREHHEGEAGVEAM